MQGSSVLSIPTVAPAGCSLLCRGLSGCTQGAGQHRPHRAGKRAFQMARHWVMTGAGLTPPLAGAPRGLTLLKALSFKARHSVKQESCLALHGHRVGGLETLELGDVVCPSLSSKCGASGSCWIGSACGNNLCHCDRRVLPTVERTEGDVVSGTGKSGNATFLNYQRFLVIC